MFIRSSLILFLFTTGAVFAFKTAKPVIYTPEHCGPIGTGNATRPGYNFTDLNDKSSVVMNFKYIDDKFDIKVANGTGLAMHITEFKETCDKLKKLEDKMACAAIREIVGEWSFIPVGNETDVMEDEFDRKFNLTDKLRNTTGQIAMKSKVIILMTLYRPADKSSGKCIETKKKTTFKCKKNNMCIYRGLKCNGVEECPDGSDERDCDDDDKLGAGVVMLIIALIISAICLSCYAGYNRYKHNNYN